MKLIVTSNKIKLEEDKILVACGHCHDMHEIQFRRMSRSELRNQPWCSRCRSEAAARSKRKGN